MAFGRKASPTSNQCGTEWLDFRDAYLPLELTRLLSAGNISAAAIILLRHKVLMNLVSDFHFQGCGVGDEKDLEFSTNLL